MRGGLVKRRLVEVDDSLKLIMVNVDKVAVDRVVVSKVGYKMDDLTGLRKEYGRLGLGYC
jgi:hypothetical protein